jgi:hypothetical protein
MKRALVQVLTALYPLSFAFAPILSLYASNAVTFRLGVVTAPMFIAMLGTLLVLAIAAVRLRDLQKAAVVTSYCAILFFSHGHFRGFAADLGIPDWLAGWLLLVVGTALAVAGAFGVARAHNLRLLTRLLSAAGVAMLALPIAHIGTFALATRHSVESVLDSLAVDSPSVDSAERPDIYYIVLDGYGRQDVLQELFDHDNEPFLEFLESRGFRVARASRANYAQTALSMSSVLNMEYVQKMIVTRPQFIDRGPLIARIRNNRVVTSLRGLGYTIVTFSTATDVVDIESPDIHFQGRNLDEFRVGVLDLTPIPVLARRIGSHSTLPLEPNRAHHANVQFKFEQLRNLSQYSRPFFVYAHFLCPHPPFVFDAQGNFLDPQRPLKLRERDWWDGYRSGYRRQVQFLNAQLRETVDVILARSPRPPVIVLQADHGPASHWVEFWSRKKNMNTSNPRIVRERMAVFNAMYLPNADLSEFDDDASLVNTFRVVMNACFGTDYELLPNHSYFSTPFRPYAFLLVDDILNGDPKGPNGSTGQDSAGAIVTPRR